MAKLKEITDQKKRVRELIAERIKSHPEVGPYEFLLMQLQERKVNTTEIQNIESARNAISTLPMKDRREIRRDLRTYNGEYFKAVQEMQKGKYDLLKKLPKNVAEIVGRGGALGVSAAGVVNTLMPSLFPTLMGYLAGTSSANTLVKLGILGASAFTPPALGQAAVLAVGAAAGVAVYGVGKGIVSATKAIRKKMNDGKNKEDR